MFPREGKNFAASYGWWLFAIPAWLIAYAALETFSTWGLGLPFWQRMPSWARIFLLVLLICVAFLGVAFLRHFFDDGPVGL